MFGLIIRIILFAAVIFGIAYGITRARKSARFAKVSAEIQEEITKLKSGLEAGLYSDEDYRQITEKIHLACERAGIDVPALPSHVRPDDGADKEKKS